MCGMRHVKIFKQSKNTAARYQSHYKLAGKGFVEKNVSECAKAYYASKQ
jgi:hypothetical protein